MNLKALKEAAPVKPLEWRDHGPDSFPEPAWSAQTPFGFYNIEEVSASDCPAYVVRLHAHHFIGDEESLDAAKAAAQADYEQRILSALANPSTILSLIERVEAMEAALREVRRRSSLLMHQNIGRWSMRVEHDKRSSDVTATNIEIIDAALSTITKE